MKTKVWLFNEAALSAALAQAVVEGMPPASQGNILQFLNKYMHPSEYSVHPEPSAPPAAQVAA